MSKKYLMVTSNFDNWKQDFFINNMSKRNQEYADIHNFEYLEFLDVEQKYRDHPTWLKFKLISDLLDDKTIKEGDTVTQIDADMCIANIDISYETNKSFSYAIDSGNTHCMGNYSIRINNWSRQMIKNILSDERYEYFKDKVYHHPFVSNYNFWGWFREQASWYSLAGISPHCEESFWNLPNYGWHSDKTEWTEYSLDELHEHVEVLPTAWNVTEMEGECNCQFLINKVNRDDVIIRHFAGGQQWRKEWFN